MDISMKKIDKIALILISNEKDDKMSHPGKLLVARSINLTNAWAKKLDTMASDIFSEFALKTSHIVINDHRFFGR